MLSSKSNLFALLLAHAAAALGAPALVSYLGRRAFLVLALFPGSAAAWALAQTTAVTSGQVSSMKIAWVPALGIDLAFRLDTLSWLMVLLVGGVGALVLIPAFTALFKPRYVHVAEGVAPAEPAG